MGASQNAHAGKMSEILKFLRCLEAACAGEKELKVVVIGMPRSGAKSLVTRWTSNSFQESHVSPAMHSPLASMVV